MSGAAPETTFRVRTLPGGRMRRFLLLLWAAGMGGMLLGLLLTFGSAFGGMAGLLLPMLWIALRLTKRAEYGAGADGLRETLLDPQGKPLGGRERRYRWDQVESWLADADLVRGVGERRFVDLRLRDGYRMRFREANEKPGDPAFSAFVAELEARLGGAASAAAVSPPQPRLPPPAPRRRGSFYGRPLAKALTLLLLAASAVLLVLAIVAPGLFTGAAWFRLTVVVIPGTLYMFARSFGRR